MFVDQQCTSSMPIKWLSAYISHAWQHGSATSSNVTTGKWFATIRGTQLRCQATLLKQQQMQGLGQSTAGSDVMNEMDHFSHVNWIM
jgi:hypothetical protein